MGDGESTGWIRHEKLLLSVLERHEQELKHMHESMHLEFTAMRVEIAKLKLQASMMGAVAGMVVGVALSLVTKLI